jgi:hypothetical protein
MRAGPEAIRTPARTAICLAQIEREAWTVLELHFLSRPHLEEEAREELGLCLRRLDADGVHDAHMLKNLACRAIQIAYGPAPSMRQAMPAAARGTAARSQAARFPTPARAHLSSAAV